MQHEALSGIRTGYADGLVGRAADVVLKERRKLDRFGMEAPVDTPRWSGLPHRDRSPGATGHATGAVALTDSAPIRR